MCPSKDPHRRSHASAPRTSRLSSEATRRGDRRRRHQPGRDHPRFRAIRIPRQHQRAGCIGVALGLLDEWLSGRDTQAPTGLAQHSRLPAGHWRGERAATDILYLAGRGRAFRSLHALITRQGGQHVLYGAALALAAT
jgi:hypothetical protein